jgi:hypothetical protein
MNAFSSVLAWLSAFTLIWLFIFDVIPVTVGTILALIAFCLVAQVDRVETEKRKEKNASINS